MARTAGTVYRVVAGTETLDLGLGLGFSTSKSTTRISTNQTTTLTTNKGSGTARAVITTLTVSPTYQSLETCNFGVLHGACFLGAMQILSWFIDYSKQTSACLSFTAFIKMADNVCSGPVHGAWQLGAWCNVHFTSSSQTHTPYFLQRPDTLVIYYTYLSGFYPVLIYREKKILTPTFLILCFIIIIYRPFAKHETNNSKNAKQKWKAVIQVTVAILLITILHT